MGKTMLGVFFGLMMVVAGASAAFALQAGGVEVGDLETGSVVGQSFKELDVDAQLFAVEIGDLKTWYPNLRFPLHLPEVQTRQMLQPRPS